MTAHAYRSGRTSGFGANAVSTPKGSVRFPATDARRWLSVRRGGTRGAVHGERKRASPRRSATCGVVVSTTSTEALAWATFPAASTTQRSMAYVPSSEGVKVRVKFVPDGAIVPFTHDPSGAVTLAYPPPRHGCASLTAAVTLPGPVNS